MALSQLRHGILVSPPCRSQWLQHRLGSHRIGIVSLSYTQMQCKSVFIKRKEGSPWPPISRGSICYAVFNGKLHSQRIDHSERALQRSKRSTGENSQSLAIRTEEVCAKVEFRMKFRTDYGNHVKVVGSASQFGAWAIAKCRAMKWNDGDIWSIVIDLPVGNIYEYKYVVVDSHGASVIHWQKGNNCVLAIGLTDTDMIVEDNWEGSPGASVTSRGKGIATKEERLMDWANEIKSQSGDTSLVLRKKRELEKAQEENRLARQESSRLKSELRMASMTRQAAEQQAKELQQENRRLLALLTEQQTTHKSVMEQALTILQESEKAEPSSTSPTATEHAQTSSTETPSVEDATSFRENGTSPGPPKTKKPRRRSNRRRRKAPVSTRTAAMSADE